jgi:hypothetical protein
MHSSRITGAISFMEISLIGGFPLISAGTYENG